MLQVSQIAANEQQPSPNSFARAPRIELAPTQPHALLNGMGGLEGLIARMAPQNESIRMQPHSLLNGLVGLNVSIAGPAPHIALVHPQPHAWNGLGDPEGSIAAKRANPGPGSDDRAHKKPRALPENAAESNHGAAHASDQQDQEEDATAAGKGHPGRNGDPRMNLAVKIRQGSPDTPLIEVLQQAGFVFKDWGSPGIKAETCLDSDGISLYQRRNQLLRRLRTARNKPEEEDDE